MDCVLVFMFHTEKERFKMAQIMEEMDTKDDKRKKRFSIWKKVPDLVYGRQLATYRKKNTKL